MYILDMLEIRVAAGHGCALENVSVFKGLAISRLSRFGREKG